MWKDSNEARYFESLNTDKSLPVEEVSPPQVEAASPFSVESTSLPPAKLTSSAPGKVSSPAIVKVASLPPLSAASPFPVYPPPAVWSFLLIWGISTALLEEMVITSLHAVAMEDNCETPQDPFPSPFSASRPITILRSQQASKDEIQSMVHEGEHYTPKELIEFSNL